MDERKSSPSLTPPPEYIPQPDHFYTSGGEPRLNPLRNLRPDDDPMATRGIPVFKPSWYEFCNFERYMEAIQPWGMKSGIVKVIPPKEWKHELPDIKPMLEDIRIRHPIEQNMLGISGLFRQQNIEKRRVYSLREWFELGMSEDFRTPGTDEVRRDLKKGAAGTGRKSRAKKEVAEASEVSASPAPSAQIPENDQQATPHEVEGTNNTDQSMDVNDDSLDIPTATSLRNDSVPPGGTSVVHHSHTTTVSGYSADKRGAPSATETDLLTSNLHMSQAEGQSAFRAIAVQDAEAAQKAALARQKKAARAALKTDLDANFLTTFDPTTAWLPPGSSAEDYHSPEFVAGLERLFWRGCGVGKPAMYGADLPGSLFSHNMGSSLVADYNTGAQLKKKNKGITGPIPWDVSNLPSALTRLLPRGMKIPGVNTPYLYFGMWRATFAWHVEDMDLFSINFLHWGAPKHWYAVPQGRANALEGVMKQFFPSDKNGCPQFLRHKSYLASPTALRSASIKPNTLVQHAGEFVITYPRGYHAGFNTGLNCAESVNFALNSWLDLGRKARFCHCVSDSVRIDVDALLAEKARIEAEEKAGIRRPQVEPRQAAIRPALPPQAYLAPTAAQRSKKRKFQESQSNLDHLQPAYRTSEKKSIELPPTKRLHREVDVSLLPCCLCASPAEAGLLPVNDPPFPQMGIPIPRSIEGVAVWKAHEICAMTIPETWVDEIDGERRVFGVDAIIKDRWNLRCSACTTFEHKAHGAPIQCAKGKCSKALHVTCAEQGKANATFRVVQIQETEVLITVDAAATLPMASTSESRDEVDPASLISVNGAVVDGGTHRVLKTIQKYVVEVLCGLHNPASVQAKRDAKAQKLHQVLLTIPIGDRVRVKFSTGVYECTLLQVNPADETVLVAWSEGGTKIFNWNKIIFGGWKADPTQRNAFSTLPNPSAPLIPPYIMTPASKPGTSKDFHEAPQLQSHASTQLPHQVSTAATQPKLSLTDHSTTLPLSDPSHHRHRVYPAHQGDFESYVGIPVPLQDAKESQADRSAYLIKEITPALPALSLDSSSNDVSMTD